MAFWSGWFGGTGASAGHRNKGVQTTGTGNAGAAVPVTNDTALQLSAVWGCTKLISETVAGMPVNFYRISPDGTKTLIPDYPLAKLFNQSANKLQTGLEFKSTMTINQSMRGNCYALKQFGIGNKLIGLVPLMAQQMRVVLNEDGNRVYEYTANGMIQRYSQDQIWHVMLFPSNGAIGLSPLEYAARSIGIGIAGEQRVSNLAQNGFKPTGVLTTDKVLKPEQRAQIRQEFSDLQEGQGDPLRVLEAGFDYQQISLSPKDVQLLESRRFQIEDIARFWSVPSILINDTQASTVWGSGISQIVEGFYKFGIKPYLARYETSIEKNLLPKEDKQTVKVEFDFESLLRGDAKTRADTAQVAINSGLMTINEMRQKEGKPPIEGGDEPYVQQQMIPLSIAQKGPANVNQTTSEG